MNKPIDLKAAKERLQRKKYEALVLSTWDRMTADEKRQQAQQRAEVERKARRQM